jgi:hypothetical protein
MPQHEHDLERLAAMTEGRLEADERAEAVAHLAECRECREVLAGLARARTDGALDLAANARPSRWRPLRIALPLAAALAVAAVALRLAVFPNDTGTRPPPPEGGAVDESVLTKRSGGVRINDKTFRMSEGTWVDDSFDATGTTPIVDVRGREAREALLARMPALGPYLELGDRVVVVQEGTVYRFSP